MGDDEGLPLETLRLLCGAAPQAAINKIPRSHFGERSRMIVAAILQVKSDPLLKVPPDDSYRAYPELQGRQRFRYTDYEKGIVSFRNGINHPQCKFCSTKQRKFRRRRRHRIANWIKSRFRPFEPTRNTDFPTGNAKSARDADSERDINSRRQQLNECPLDCRSGAKPNRI